MLANSESNFCSLRFHRKVMTPSAWSFRGSISELAMIRASREERGPSSSIRERRSLLRPAWPGLPRITGGGGGAFSLTIAAPPYRCSVDREARQPSTVWVFGDQPSRACPSAYSREYLLSTVLVAQRVSPVG